MLFPISLCCFTGCSVICRCWHNWWQRLIANPYRQLAVKITLSCRANVIIIITIKVIINLSCHFRSRTGVQKSYVALWYSATDKKLFQSEKNDTCFATTHCPASNNFTTDTTHTFAHTDHIISPAIPIPDRHQNADATFGAHWATWQDGFTDWLVNTILHQILNANSSMPQLVAAGNCSLSKTPVAAMNGELSSLGTSALLRSLVLLLVMCIMWIHLQDERRQNYGLCSQCDWGCHGHSTWKVDEWD